MGKPDIQHVKATLVYDGVAHDLFANWYIDHWLGSIDHPLEIVPDKGIVIDTRSKDRITAAEAIADAARQVIEDAGLVIA